MVGNHCHKCRSIKVHPGGHLVSLVLLCSCWLDPAVNVNDSIWYGTIKVKLVKNWILKSNCQPLINSDLSIILAPYGEQPWPPLSCIQAHQTSPCQEQPAKFWFQNDKISAKGILFYLAIRSQPDADVEDLVVVEEGEGEGAVRSSMSAVSHQKTPILSNWKTI